MITVIPAIDIIEGRCVRLTKGDYGTGKVYGDPLDMAKAFLDAGASRIHLVDLDGAKASSPCNLKVLEQVASIGLKPEWGGGIKTAEALSSVFNSGACWAIIGSIAVKNPELFASWLETYGAQRMILGADVRGRNVAVNGWKEDSPVTISELITSFPGLQEVICTDISRDGTLTGPSLDLYKSLQEEFPQIAFTVSGGISSAQDISEVEAMGMSKVIVGKAFYEGRVTLKELSQWWQNE